MSGALTKTDIIPLVNAAWQRSFANVKQLVYDNHQDLKTGFRAIDFAAFQGHSHVVEKLLQCGAAAEVFSEEGNIDKICNI